MGGRANDTRERPNRVVVDANGNYWRAFDGYFSMCPTSDDNDSVNVVATYELVDGAPDVHDDPSWSQESAERFGLEVLFSDGPSMGGWRLRPDDHHRNCATKRPEGCDCYARAHQPARDAIARLLAESRNATYRSDG